ncbi:MCE family protein [Saccharopolyspora gloriosae]|uniref:Virulence factor Mce-like protein n=1 Tax=Saccharopolyspora gloriosae TaxID=455344 RepID=A0A840NCU3_9PSEU|nr:MCE family protein [Saccharopolyspora gloriosae]MBB5067052.1 virulence factor Mce-like protein [Saccharopolyspora gloriosae]
MSTRSALFTARRRLLGLSLLMCIMLFFAFTIATYQRAFESSVDVVLKAARSGNQLLPESDVKAHGMIIGRVDEVRPTDEGAELHLALEPDKARLLPANVSARLLPRTLFGERYVSLDVPEQASSTRLAAGDVISQDRTRASVELETVLADTMPVLQAVHPDDLAVTLNSLDQALDGRGEEVGDTITRLNQYVEGLNPSVPQLQENLRQLVGVAETYEQAAPDVLQALGDLSVTSRTLVDQQENLRSLTSQLTTTSNDATGFLEANGDDLIRLGESTRPTADVLAKYSPSFPCFLKGMADYVPLINDAFGVGTKEPGLHITLEIVPNRGKYIPNQDEPVYGDKRGPRCYDFVNGPKPFPQYPPDGPLNDGSVPPPAARTGNEGLLPSGGAPASTSPQSASAPALDDLGLQNSPAERDMVSTVLAPTMGTSAQGVPGWGSLLVGPVLRGAEVSYR